jgi:predicted RNase H-like nuclease (RuvC/YqgF family)
MTYTLSEAVKATGKAKSTIHAAIKKGRISAQMNDIGEYVIDPSELHRVFPLNVQSNDKTNNTGQTANTGLLIENATLKAKLEALEQINHQLENRLDKADQQNSRLTALLEAPKTDPYAAILERLEAIEKEVVSSPAPTTEPPPKSFWRRLVG